MTTIMGLTSFYFIFSLLERGNVISSAFAHVTCGRAGPRHASVKTRSSAFYVCVRSRVTVRAFRHFNTCVVCVFLANAKKKNGRKAIQNTS